jgi:tRNA (cmo5U34)-methyltransferase
MILNKDNDFTFSGIANEFNRHVTEQLPWYNMIKGIVSFIIRSYVNKNGLIYDIGCSTGNIIKEIENIIKERNVEVIAIDTEKEMLDLYPDIGVKKCIDCMSPSCEYEPFDVSLLFLTCQFLESNKRKDFLYNLYSKKKKNGIMIVVDKFISKKNDGYFSGIMNRFNLLLKLKNNLNASDILNKELSLSGIQIPLHCNELPGKKTEFFRIGDFRGYVIK